MIYADYNGSAPLAPEIAKYLQKRLIDGPYANPNAIHSLGKKMNLGYEKARQMCAMALGCMPNQIIFNSGSSEGITHVFHSVLSSCEKSKNIIVTSGIEHSAVVQACAYYEKQGFEVIKIKTTQDGTVDLVEFKNTVENNKDKIALVTIMAANNETGVIQPWQEMTKLCNSSNIPFFSDTTQYIGKTAFNFSESGMDYAVLSGHKIGAIIGSGLIMAKDPSVMKPLIFGGGQEAGLRGGTQNYIGAETIALALSSFVKNQNHLKEVEEARIVFEKNIKEKFPKVNIIGEQAPRLASTTLISYPGIHGQAVQVELESQDIFVTTSSACSDNQPETSKVLKSMGIDDETGRGVVRISLCLGEDCSKYATIEKALESAYTKLEKIKY